MANGGPFGFLQGVPSSVSENLAALFTQPDPSVVQRLFPAVSPIPGFPTVSPVPEFPAVSPIPGVAPDLSFLNFLPQGVLPVEQAGISTLEAGISPLAGISPIQLPELPFAGAPGGIPDITIPTQAGQQGAAQTLIEQIIGPRLQNLLTAQGLGRSGAGAEALSLAGAQIGLPIAQQTAQAAAQAEQARFRINAAIQLANLEARRTVGLQAQQLEVQAGLQAQQLEAQRRGVLSSLQRFVGEQERGTAAERARLAGTAEQQRASLEQQRFLRQAELEQQQRFRQAELGQQRFLQQTELEQQRSLRQAELEQQRAGEAARFLSAERASQRATFPFAQLIPQTTQQVGPGGITTTTRAAGGAPSVPGGVPTTFLPREVPTTFQPRGFPTVVQGGRFVTSAGAPFRQTGIDVSRFLRGLPKQLGFGFRGLGTGDAPQFSPFSDRFEFRTGF